MTLENILLCVLRRDFTLFVKSLNFNFVFISVPCVSLCYLHSFTLSILGRNISIKPWDMWKAILEKKKKSFRLNPKRYPFCLVGVSKFFTTPHREQRVPFEELWPKHSWGNNDPYRAVYPLTRKLLFTMNNLYTD